MKIQKNNRPSSYEIICHINKSFNLGGDIYSSYTQFVMAEGLKKQEAASLAEALNQGYKKIHSEHSEKEPRMYTADYWSNRQALGEGDIQRKYSADSNNEVKIKSPKERKEIIQNLETMLGSEKRFEMFGALGRELYFYREYLGGYCKYHGA